METERSSKEYFKKELEQARLSVTCCENQLSFHRTSHQHKSEALKGAFCELQALRKAVQEVGPAANVFAEFDRHMAGE